MRLRRLSRLSRLRRFRSVLAFAVVLVVSVGIGVLGGGVAGAQPAAGVVVPFGTVSSYGGPNAGQLSGPVTGIVADPAGSGYWLVAADGGIFAYGTAGFYGSMGGGLNEAVTGMAATPDGKGYWLADSTGFVTAFGDAGTFPTYIPQRSAPVVGIAATPDGKGIWQVGADGGVFAFGDAGFFGSMGGTPLNQPIVGMAATPDGKGYRLVAADGGVFAFGDAAFSGSTGAAPPATPVVGMASAPGGGGYWLATSVKTEPVASALPTVQANCSVPTSAGVIEPGSILLACGDGNARLVNLDWSSWTASRATATGVYSHNLCVPDCAQGTFVSTPATVALGDPVQTVGGREFAQLALSYADASTPGGQATITTVISVSQS